MNPVNTTSVNVSVSRPQLAVLRVLSFSVGNCTQINLDQTYEDCRYSGSLAAGNPVSIALAVIISVMLLIILPCNTLVIVLVIRTKQLHIPMNYYVASMCTSDMTLSTVLVVMFYVTELVTFTPSQVCVLYKGLSFLNGVLFNSVYSVVAIAVNRHRLVANPLDCNDNNCQAIFVISGLWGSGVIYSLISFLMLMNGDPVNSYAGGHDTNANATNDSISIISENNCRLTSIQREWLYAVDLIFVYILPVVVCSFLYGQTISILKKRSKRVAPQITRLNRIMVKCNEIQTVDSMHLTGSQSKWQVLRNEFTTRTKSDSIWNLTGEIPFDNPATTVDENQNVFGQFSVTVPKVSENKSVGTFRSTAPAREFIGVLMKNRRRTIHMMIVIAILFAISWAPYHIFATVMLLSAQATIQNELVYNILRSLSLVLILLNAWLNVLVYGYFNENFHRAVHIQLRRIKDKISIWGPGARSKMEKTEMRV